MDIILQIGIGVIGGLFTAVVLRFFHNGLKKNYAQDLTDYPTRLLLESF